MKSKISSFSVALLLTLMGPGRVPAQGQTRPPLSSAAARAYYQINNKFYYVKKIEDVYPLVPKGQRLFLEALPKQAQDNKARYYSLFYLTRPQMTDEVDAVDKDGPIADLTGYAYKWFNGKWVKVQLFVRMQQDEDDKDWRFVSQRYEGSV